MFNILDPLWAFFAKDMGIDLGTANTLVCVRNEGIVLSEPSVVAVKKGTNKVLLDGDAVGDVAKRMVGMAPGNIQVIRPLKHGVIADFDMTEAMLRYFIRKVHRNRSWARPRVVISVPSGITPVEKRAVRSSAERASAREVYPIEEPIAACIGAGLPIMDPAANMVVDIGGGTTEVAVISLASIVHCTSLRVAGDDLDGAIVQHMRRNYNLIIGERTAEMIKMQIGSAYPLDEEMTMEVRGRDMIAGLPRMTTINSEEIREAIQEPILQIVGAIKSTLEKTPPELSGDLLDRGIWLCGGGALIRGVDKLIARETGLSVQIADEPLTAVARGCGVLLDQLEVLRQIRDNEDDER